MSSPMCPDHRWRGLRVQTAHSLLPRGFTAEARAERKPGSTGRIENGEHAVYLVVHDDGSHACYEPDELLIGEVPITDLGTILEVMET